MSTTDQPTSYPLLFSSEQASYIFYHSFNLFISSSLVNHSVTVLTSSASSKLWPFFKKANQKVSLPYLIPHGCHSETEFLLGCHTRCFVIWPITAPPAFSDTCHYSLLILTSDSFTIKTTFWFSE